MRVSLQFHNLPAKNSRESNPPREPPAHWEAETIIRIFLTFPVLVMGEAIY